MDQYEVMIQRKFWKVAVTMLFSFFLLLTCKRKVNHQHAPGFDIIDMRGGKCICTKLFKIKILPTLNFNCDFHKIKLKILKWCTLCTTSYFSLKKKMIYLLEEYKDSERSSISSFTPLMLSADRAGPGQCQIHCISQGWQRHSSLSHYLQSTSQDELSEPTCKLRHSDMECGHCKQHPNHSITHIHKDPWLHYHPGKAWVWVLTSHLLRR